MVDFIRLRDGYQISEKLKRAIHHCQQVKGKIIEEELRHFVEDRVISGIRLESSVGLHTLRINLGEISDVGERDLVIHMAKESLRAMELSPLKVETGYSEKGIFVRFRKDIKTELIQEEEAREESGLEIKALEKGISGKTLEGVGKITAMLKYSGIESVFPSWHYEDWVQILFPNRWLIFRIDPHGLWGVGVGRDRDSTLHPNSKDETIFYWDGCMNDNLRRYYGDSVGDSTSYGGWDSAKVKVRTREES